MAVLCGQEAQVQQTTIDSLKYVTLKIGPEPYLCTEPHVYRDAYPKTQVLHTPLLKAYGPNRTAWNSVPLYIEAEFSACQL